MRSYRQHSHFLSSLLLVALVCFFPSTIERASVPLPLGFFKPASTATSSASPSDDFESYSDAAAVDTLSGGTDWNGAYSDRTGPALGIQSSDDMESYSDTAAVDSLNGGTTWDGAFVDR